MRDLFLLADEIQSFCDRSSSVIRGLVGRESDRGDACSRVESSRTARIWQNCQS